MSATKGSRPRTRTQRKTVQSKKPTRAASAGAKQKAKLTKNITGKQSQRGIDNDNARRRRIDKINAAGY